MILSIYRRNVRCINEQSFEFEFITNKKLGLVTNIKLSEINTLTVFTS